MNYFRKIIYLRESGQEGNAGYMKLSKKGEWIRLEIHIKKEENWRGKPVYLVLEKEGKRYPLEVGKWKGEEEKRPLEGKVSPEETMVGIWIGKMGESQIGEGIPMEKEEIPAQKEEIPAQEEEITAQEEEIKAQEDEQMQEEEPEIIQFEMEEEHTWDYECRKIISTHSPMYPFPDDEAEYCVKIEPGDLGEFPRKYWILSSNPFLQQGYGNYGHLLFAKIGKEYYIGVPGCFHKRDVVLGRNFGFSLFKSIHRGKIKMGDFGYWMMEVHARPGEKNPQDWECASEIKGKSNMSPSNSPPEEDKLTPVDRP